MADSETSPWLISVRAVRRAADTASAAVWLPTPNAGPTSLRIRACDGEAPGQATVALIADPAFCQRLVTAREPILVVQDASTDGRPPAVLVVPLLAADRVLGFLTLPTGEYDSLREVGEQGRIAAFCAVTALACQLAQIQRDQRQDAVSADRDRIARELHDQVIQQLFGAGLLVQGLEGFVPSGAASRLHEVVERLDRAIIDIRRSIYVRQVVDEDEQGSQAKL